MADPGKIQKTTTDSSQNINSEAKSGQKITKLPPNEPDKNILFNQWGKPIAENNNSKLYAVGKKYVIQRLNGAQYEYYYLTSEKNKEQAIESFKFFTKDFNSTSTQWHRWKTLPTDAPLVTYSFATGQPNTNDRVVQNNVSSGITRETPSITTQADTKPNVATNQTVKPITQQRQQQNQPLQEIKKETPPNYTIIHPQTNQETELAVGDYVEVGGSIIIGFTPAGVVVDAVDLYEAVKEGDGWGIAIAIFGFIPGVGDGAKAAYKLKKTGDKIRKATQRMEQMPSSQTIELFQKHFKTDLVPAGAGRQGNINIGDQPFSFRVPEKSAIQKIETPDVITKPKPQTNTQKPAPAKERPQTNLSPKEEKELDDLLSQHLEGTGVSRNNPNTPKPEKPKLTDEQKKFLQDTARRAVTKETAKRIAEALKEDKKRQESQSNPADNTQPVAFAVEKQQKELIDLICRQLKGNNLAMEEKVKLNGLRNQYSANRPKEYAEIQAIENSNNKPEQKISRLSALLDKKALPQADFQDFTIDEEIREILKKPAIERSLDDERRLLELQNKKKWTIPQIEEEIERLRALPQDADVKEKLALLLELLGWMKGRKEQKTNNFNKISKFRLMRALSEAEKKEFIELFQELCEKIGKKQLFEQHKKLLDNTQKLSAQETAEYLLIFKELLGNTSKLYLDLEYISVQKNGKVVYGHGFLSEKVKNFRNNLSSKSKGEKVQFSPQENEAMQSLSPEIHLKATTAFNVATISYIDPSTGLLNYKMAISDAKKAEHSEELLLDLLQNRQIPYENVISWYSELQPCNHKDHQCRLKLQEHTPNAFVNYSFDYPTEFEKHKDFIKNGDFAK